jgi:exopolyphosphatase / guanosine-5'-triphosphate,3'-diphosphate pyrophosphatase
MRLGVLDVGSNTVHLLVVDAHRGAAPLPATSHKERLRLAEHLTDAGEVSADGVDALVRSVRAAVEVAEDRGASRLLPFATSALREATNSATVLAVVERATGVRLQVLSGDEEARLTFLAARRWFGWSAGRLIVLDIGGGSLELAVGDDELPELAESLPLGAGRLTRDMLRGRGQTVAGAGELKRLRRHVRAEVAGVVGRLRRGGTPGLAAATSKTFRSLARLSGAAASDQGRYVRRSLSRADLADLVAALAGTDARRRAELPGVSKDRAPQLLAGAVVAHAALDLLELDEVEVCPWALREGVILSYFDALPTSGARPTDDVLARAAGWSPGGEHAAPVTAT